MKLALVAPLFLLGTSLLVGCADTEESGSVPVVDLDPQAATHLKGGKGSEPAFVDNGLTLSALGGLSGLGNGDILVNLSAVGQPHATCTNPAGANQPAGQNPVEVTLTGSQSIPASEIKNGTVKFNLSTGAPASPIAGAPDCPNANWTEVIEDVSFSSATLTVAQGGYTVLNLHCTISPSSSNGAISAASVVCN